MNHLIHTRKGFFRFFSDCKEVIIEQRIADETKNCSKCGGLIKLIVYKENEKKYYFIVALKNIQSLKIL